MQALKTGTQAQANSDNRARMGTGGDDCCCEEGYIQARFCSDDSLADVFMLAGSAEKIVAFYYAGDCYYFDGDAGTPGTIITPDDIFPLDSCDDCNRCVNCEGAAPPTVTVTLTDFPSCAAGDVDNAPLGLSNVNGVYELPEILGECSYQKVFSGDFGTYYDDPPGPDFDTCSGHSFTITQILISVQFLATSVLIQVEIAAGPPSSDTLFSGADSPLVAPYDCSATRVISNDVIRGGGGAIGGTATLST